MKLTKTEIAQIGSIMNNYRSVHESLNFYEKNLGLMEKGIIEKNRDEISSLSIKIKETISKLQQERAKEKDFFGLLEQKYGPGQFDVETFEYKTTK